MAASTSHAADYRPLFGKVALVTGASRGIGAAIARNLASKGATLILNYVSSSSFKSCEELSLSLTAKYGVQHLIIQSDMGSPTGPEDLIKSAAAKLPTLKLDIIINNAGVLGIAKLEDCTTELFEKVYSVNVRGPMLLLKAALPYLPHDRSGRIVNISSIGSKLYSEGLSVYGSSKAALESMTRVWAAELSSRATVNCVSPGPVLTDMVKSVTIERDTDSEKLHFKAPLAQVREGIDDEEIIKLADRMGGRPAYVHEIAGIVGLLTSDESSWCTGQNISASGGMTMSL